MFKSVSLLLLLLTQSVFASGFYGGGGYGLGGGYLVAKSGGGGGGGVPWENTHSVQFTAASHQYVDCGNVVQDEWNTAASWSVWARFTSFPAQSSLISKIGAGGAYRGYLLYVDSSHNLGWFKETTYNVNALYVTTTNTIPSTGTWYHIAVTNDSTGRAAGTRIYVNGVSKTLNIVKDNLSASIANTVQLTFGVDNEGGFADWHDGYMTQIAHYDHALTQAEVTALAASSPMVDPRTVSTPDHLWQLGNPSDAIGVGGAKDSVGAINCDYINTPVISTVHP